MWYYRCMPYTPPHYTHEVLRLCGTICLAGSSDSCCPRVQILEGKLEQEHKALWEAQEALTEAAEQREVVDATVARQEGMLLSMETALLSMEGEMAQRGPVHVGPEASLGPLGSSGGANLAQQMSQGCTVAVSPGPSAAQHLSTARKALDELSVAQLELVQVLCLHPPCVHPPLWHSWS